MSELETGPFSLYSLLALGGSEPLISFKHKSFIEWNDPAFLLYIVANVASGEEEVVVEMNPQEKEFLEMSHEFTGDCSETDVLQVKFFFVFSCWV